MLITKKSKLTGVERTLDIPVMQEQIDAWQNGVLIQNAMPNLTKDEREFMMTGSTSEEWDDIFGTLGDE